MGEEKLTSEQRSKFPNRKYFFPIRKQRFKCLLLKSLLEREFTQTGG